MSSRSNFSSGATHINLYVLLPQCSKKKSSDKEFLTLQDAYFIFNVLFNDVVSNLDYIAVNIKSNECQSVLSIET
jgi:hypothetical protein